MLSRLRYILPVVVLLVFGGWVYSDDIPKPDLGAPSRTCKPRFRSFKTRSRTCNLGEGAGRGRQGSAEAESRARQRAARPSRGPRGDAGAGIRRLLGSARRKLMSAGGVRKI